jgi:hypothetical protein
MRPDLAVAGHDVVVWELQDTSDLCHRPGRVESLAAMAVFHYLQTDAGLISNPRPDRPARLA